MITTLRSKITPRTVLAVAAMSLLVSVVMGRENAPPAVIALSAPVMAGVVSGDAADLDVQALQRARNAGEIPDLFAPRTPPVPVTPEVVSPEPAAPEAPPSAPPLPFTYLGKLLDGDKLAVFIARGDEHYSVKQGETLDGQYKVENVTANAITFIYVPLGIRQRLPIPAPK